ncbi:MAG: phospholipid carrier-dependent glycosyltransferase [Nitratireductor sp.]|uniref:phospholipid carrier-dependent glycosyltransferase n=1 Tax=Alphaproteobacteria TaxID=28211 RepID=UPI00326A4080
MIIPLSPKHERPATIAVVVIWYVFHLHALNVVPLAGADETSLLNIPFRFVELGDWRYPLIYSDTYNAGDVRAYPFLLSFAPRALFHELVGFSAGLSRWFSALLMLGTAMMTVVLALRHSGSRQIALAIAAVFAASPTIFHLSRSVRFEQETVFFGVASVALPFLLLNRAHNAGATPRPWRGTFVWGLASASCALAAGAHPLPLGFGLPLAVNIFLGHAYWAPRDGLNRIGRLACVLAGGLPFVVASVAPLAYVNGGYANYLAAMAGFVEQRNNTFTDLYAAITPSFLFLLGRSAAVEITAIAETTFAWRNEIKVLALGAKISPFIIVAILLAAAFKSRRRLLRADGLPGLVGLSTLFGLVAVKVLYSPSTNYGVYIAVGCLLASAMPPAIIVNGPDIWRKTLFGALALTAASSFLTSIPHAADVATARLWNAFTLDRKFAFLREEGEKAFGPIRHASQPSPRIYTDTVAWMAAFPQEHSYLEILSGTNTGSVDGVAVDVVSLDWFLKNLPVAEGTATAQELKTDRFLSAIKPLQLGTIIHARPYGEDTLLYRRPSDTNVPLRLRHITRNEDIALEADLSFALARNGDEWAFPRIVAPGCYLVAARPVGIDPRPPMIVGAAPADEPGQLASLGVGARTGADMIFKLAVTETVPLRPLFAPGIERIEAHRLSPDPAICAKL